VKKRVIIADDHDLILDGVSNLLKDFSEIEIVGTAKTGHELLEKTKKLMPDMVISDIEMPELSGIEAVKIIKDLYPKIKTVILSMHNDSVIETILVKIDVDGIIYKNASEETIAEAILDVARGKKVRFSAGEKTAPLLTGGISLEQADLTSREIQIIKMIAEGLSNKEIGIILNVSPRTVDTHRTNLMKKLNLHSAVDVTRFAFKNKIL
jgi:DNA-binding NarL/FixJ family response regulator